MLKLINELETLTSGNLSDALDALKIEGVLVGLECTMVSRKIIGPAYTIEYQTSEHNSESFKMAANYIDEVPPGSAIVIDNQGKKDCSVWGEILTAKSIISKFAGTVINGSVRDIDQISQSEYPISYLHTVPRSGKNRVKLKNTQQKIIIGKVVIEPGDIIFADQTGVIAIPIDQIEDVIAKAKQVQVNERQIIKDLIDGYSVAEARKNNNYDQPWTKSK